jgi:hypothetical protein
LAVSNARLDVAPEGIAEPFTTIFVATSVSSEILLLVMVTVLEPTYTLPLTLRSPTKTALLVLGRYVSYGLFSKRPLAVT